MASARSIRLRGVVQGVGFRPFVYRLARANTLGGWVLNDEDGVEIYLEGPDRAVEAFVRDLRIQPPPAADIAEMEVRAATPIGIQEFTIRESQRRKGPTVRVSPDLPVCDECLQELFDPGDRRYEYPYINCTNCGPRYTVLRALPYDRPNTTMKDWPLDDYCRAEYLNPANRRFHAQPVACPRCGPNYSLHENDGVANEGKENIRRAVELLKEGKILAVKGLGGYHLACDAYNCAAVTGLRERKYRKERPFALMARDLEVARGVVELSAEAEVLLTSTARPIVLAPARAKIAGVAPENDELGVMLPYTPLHHMLYAAGAPRVLVMTSANRSSEPIAYQDQDAFSRLSGIADAFLVGQRPIARRVDDSVARAGAFGPVILRRARGFAPGAVATLPTRRPILALGADLKNAVTLVVDGQALVSQHIGDLADYQSFRAFQETVRDLLAMYEVDGHDLLVVHDCHPQYVSTAYASEMKVSQRLAIQHHLAHVASVLAERGAWDQTVVGVSFDGTGYGDDGSIWGGEIFVGSVRRGFKRTAHLRPALLPGGDAAARFPVQAAAGFLAQIGDLPELSAAPFHFPERYQSARKLLGKGVRSFTTTSMGRLFDTAAALLGFTREITFEGQAAMWLEHLARGASEVEPYPFPFNGKQFDFEPLLRSLIEDRLRGRPISEIARRVQTGFARGLADALMSVCRTPGLDTVILSGGVFQNELLVEDLKTMLHHQPLKLWTNHAVPPNDGGISLGQAALATFAQQKGPAFTTTP